MRWKKAPGESQTVDELCWLFPECARLYFQIEWREFCDPKHRQTVVVLTWLMLQPPDYIENVTKSDDTLNIGTI